jgi:hypothetical protein
MIYFLNCLKVEVLFEITHFYGSRYALRIDFFKHILRNCNL